MVIALSAVIHFVGKRGVENEFYAVIEQRNDMTVGQLRRVADRLGGHSLNAHIVDFP